MAYSYQRVRASSLGSSHPLSLGSNSLFLYIFIRSYPSSLLHLNLPFEDDSVSHYPLNYAGCSDAEVVTRESSLCYQ